MEALGSWRIYLCRDTSASAADVSKSPASSVCYARSGRYVARTQAVGLGPAKPGSDAAEVEPLGGRVTRAAAILPSRACSEAGIGRGETGQHNTPTGVRPSSKGGPRSASTSKSCVGGGRRMVSVLNFGVSPVRGRRAWWDEKRGVREQASTRTSCRGL